MPTVTLRRPRGRRRRRNRGPHAVLAARGGPTVRLPIAPRETEATGDAVVITALDRPGRKPLTRVTGRGLRVTSFTTTLAKRQGLTLSVEDQLRPIRRIARQGDPLIYQHGSQLDAGVWRISNLTATVMHRTPDTNEASRVDVAVELTEATDTEWDGSSGRRRRRNRDRDRGGDKPRMHVWRKGDTPARVSRRYYGRPDRWQLIAAANDVRRWRRIKVGRRLRIPARRRGRPGRRRD